jgi:hypothetical protein
VTLRIVAVAAVAAGLVLTPAGRGAEPAASVAEIQIKHDRALIQELAEYLRKNSAAADRDQAYAALFNKAI